MSSLLWPLATTAVLITVMYLTCVRPMRRGTGSRGAAQDADIVAKRRTELAALRVEVAHLRGQPGSPPVRDTAGDHDTTAAAR